MRLGLGMAVMLDTTGNETEGTSVKVTVEVLDAVLVKIEVEEAEMTVELLEVLLILLSLPKSVP